ncbi:DUF2691 family protein [Paenibacillus terrigena]|uniref:DUF2691 family protein n=1 Tax=Paenibacillus terrigena TaxID=369333 RepID=UPI0028D1A45C|nr:DUF2691 family protein [Paenibacillus terrigena]
MIRGISFEIPNEYGCFLREILKPLNMSVFNWYVGGEEAYFVDDGELGESLFPGEIIGLDGVLLKDILEKNAYVIFANLKAFPKDKNVLDVRTYEEFLHSYCELVLLLIDCSYVAIYCKDKEKLERLFDNAKRNCFEKIQYITDENDFRTRLSVW